MGIFKDILVTLGSIASHLARMNATLGELQKMHATFERDNDALTRIAVALEPTPKAGPEVVVAQPIKVSAEPIPIPIETKRRGKYKGYFGLQNFRRYGISEGQAAEFCRQHGYEMFRINGHSYCKESDYKEIIKGLQTK